MFQIDSVNVLQRAQYLPLYSRMGPYDVELLHRAAGRAPRRLFEYWAHEAAFVDVSLWPALQFRMDSGARMWGGMARIIEEKPEFVAWVLDEVRANGPLTAREIEHDAPRDKDNWGWNWSEVKMALEYLFYKGEVTAARRNGAVRAGLRPPRTRASRSTCSPSRRSTRRRRTSSWSVMRPRPWASARPSACATTSGSRPSRRRAPSTTLVDAGELLPATITGWKRPAFLHAEAPARAPCGPAPCSARSTR